jgi:hypothetical protein
MRLTVDQIDLLAKNYSIGIITVQYLENCLNSYYLLRFNLDTSEEWLAFKQNCPEEARALAALDLALCEYLHEQKDFATVYETIKNSPNFCIS